MIPIYIKVLPTPPHLRTYVVPPPEVSHGNTGSLLAPTWTGDDFHYRSKPCYTKPCLDPLDLLEESHSATTNRVVSSCFGLDSFASSETTTCHAVTSRSGHSEAYSDSTDDRINSGNDAIKATTPQGLTRETGKSAEASVPAPKVQLSRGLADWFLDDTWLDEILSPTNVFSEQCFKAHQDTLCEEQPPHVGTSLQLSATYSSGKSFSAATEPYHRIDSVRYGDRSPQSYAHLVDITQPLMLLRSILFKELKWDPCQTLVDRDWLRCEIDNVLVKCHEASAQAIKHRLEGNGAEDQEPPIYTSPTTHRSWAHLQRNGPVQRYMTQRRSIYWFTKLPKGHVKFRFSGRRNADDEFGDSSFRPPLSGRVAFTPGPEICATGVSVRYTRPWNFTVESAPLCPFNRMHQGVSA